jgi:hypothetical protein
MIELLFLNLFAVPLIRCSDFFGLKQVEIMAGSFLLPGLIRCVRANSIHFFHFLLITHNVFLCA